MTTALPAAPATPIFDEVDRWWRDRGEAQAPGSMLSFAGARSGPLRTATATAASGPRHRPVRPPVPPS